jgi:TM2 domain-containing membrane protein YozV
LSLLIPGLGQIYGGERNKGAATIAAAIVIGNLNIIVLPLISMANPDTPTETQKARATWAYWIPRVMHDVISVWSIAFWIWAVGDAIAAARKNK